VNRPTVAARDAIEQDQQSVGSLVILVPATQVPPPAHWLGCVDPSTSQSRRRDPGRSIGAALLSRATSGIASILGDVGNRWARARLGPYPRGKERATRSASADKGGQAYAHACISASEPPPCRGLLARLTPRLHYLGCIQGVKSRLERLQPPKRPIPGSHRRNTAALTGFIGRQEPRHLGFPLQRANPSPSAILVGPAFLLDRPSTFRG
jgi:hypothetical protein